VLKNSEKFKKITTDTHQAFFAKYQQFLRAKEELQENVIISYEEGNQNDRKRKDRPDIEAEEPVPTKLSRIDPAQEPLPSGQKKGLPLGPELKAGSTSTVAGPPVSKQQAASQQQASHFEEGEVKDNEDVASASSRNSSRQKQRPAKRSLSGRSSVSAAKKKRRYESLSERERERSYRRKERSRGKGYFEARIYKDYQKSKRRKVYSSSNSRSRSFHSGS